MTQIEYVYTADGHIDYVATIQKLGHINAETFPAEDPTVRENRMRKFDQEMTKKYLETTHQLPWEQSIFSNETKDQQNFTFDDWQAGLQPNQAAAKSVVAKAQALAGNLLANPDATMHIFITGKAGTGKTSLAIAMSHMLNAELTVMFVSVVDWLNLQYQALRDPSLNTKLNYTNASMRTADVLILDDLGRESINQNISDMVNNSLYSLADARVNKTTIMTSNEKTNNLTQRYGHAIASRLFSPNPEYTISTDSLVNVRLANESAN